MIITLNTVCKLSKIVDKTKLIDKISTLKQAENETIQSFYFRIVILVFSQIHLVENEIKEFAKSLNNNIDVENADISEFEEMFKALIKNKLIAKLINDKLDKKKL